MSDNYRILIPLGIAQLLSYAGIVFLVIAIIMTILAWRSRRKQIELRPGD